MQSQQWEKHFQPIKKDYSYDIKKIVITSLGSREQRTSCYLCPTAYIWMNGVEMMCHLLVLWLV